jgi:hypothetical protein
VTVGLRVTDNESATATATRLIQVVRPPVARLTAGPNPATPGQTVLLDAGASTDPDGIINSYRWDLDGSGTFATTTGSTPFLGRAYPAAGTYPVVVRVTDNYGNSATAATTVTVTAPPADPVTPPPPAPKPPAAPPAADNPLAPVIVPGAPATGGIPAEDAPALLPGSDHYFAAVTGHPVRFAKLVAARGLLLGVQADRSVTFRLTLSVTARDAYRLRLLKAKRSRRGSRGPSTVKVGSAVFTLPEGGGTKPLNVKLSAPARAAIRRASATVTILVTGTASDDAGHQTKLTRAFLLKR